MPVRLLLVTAVVLSGFAGLAWETLWQIEAALALGVSARGTALTLVAIMGGMSVGSIAMGRFLQHRPRLRVGRVYAMLEVVVALAGLLMLPGFRAIAGLDRMVWQSTPALAPLLHVLAILVLLGPATLAMGATLPVFGALARPSRLTIATLYGTNTAGAALGVLTMSFFVLPEVGMATSVSLMATLDLIVALLAWFLPAANSARAHGDAPAGAPGVPGLDLITALSTGIATFCLEVAWFRSLRATFQSSTESFAIILVAVLVPLALAGYAASILRRRVGRPALPLLLAGAGLCVLLLTPLVERLDRILPLASYGYGFLLTVRLLWSLLLLGPPVLLLGTAMPLLLATHESPQAQGRIYAVNTAGAILGSLVAAWLVLPYAGATATAWLVGLFLCGLAAALAHGRPKQRWLILGAASLALGAAVLGRSGVGRLRVQSQTVELSHRVLATHEGPDATVSAIEVPGGDRILVIDGFETTAETATAHYMAWMGRLPMLLHAHPQAALVICFGTGQTAAAVKDEGAETLDIVELDPAVLRLAPFFRTNHDVLGQPGVRTQVMDGRAWLRRTQRRYDVVTLEPMSPEFAGTNALYSVELYRWMAGVLNPGAIVAQWVPFHIVPPASAVAIVSAFVEVFPDALLWVDPRDRTGIVVGRRAGAETPIASLWPGLSRSAAYRDLSPELITGAVALGPTAITTYAALGLPVDDDNQALSYGRLPYHRMRYGGRMVDANLDLVAKVRDRSRRP
jgi:spermidine synthase